MQLLLLSFAECFYLLVIDKQRNRDESSHFTHRIAILLFVFYLVCSLERKSGSFETVIWRIVKFSYDKEAKLRTLEFGVAIIIVFFYGKHVTKKKEKGFKKGKWTVL